MPRRVKDFIEISEYTSLEDLIRYLKTIRDSLPPEHEAEIKIRGDEVFGRRLTISYLRDQTAEEAELEARYSKAGQDTEEIERLRSQLDDIPYDSDEQSKS
ncbi:phage-related protein [Sphingomonas sp. F9_3S_D5_B_2]